MERETLHPDRNYLKDVWSNEGSFATTLLVAFIDAYGSEALEWSPISIHWEIHDDFGVVLPNNSLDRLMTAITILTSNSFYTSLPDFNDFCCILSGEAASPRMLQLAGADDIAWGLTEGIMISPPDDEDENPFSEEIIGFIGEIVHDEGLINPPDILKIGKIGRDLKGHVNDNFSDDPEMFTGIWKMEESKTGDINALVKARLHALFGQLESMRLKNGNTSNITRRMRENLTLYGQKK